MTYRTWQMRRNTAALAAASNPVLAAGEPGYETDTGKLKIGDGATAWNSLPYVTSADNLVFDDNIDFSGITISNLNIGTSTTIQGAPTDPISQIPALRNRVLRIQDGAGTPNTLEIHQAYIPFFRSAGFSQANLNGILCGGFWVDQYQACQPAASNVSRGGLTPDSPGAGVGAACKPHVVPWTDLSWTTAKTAIENRGGSANRQSGTCAVYASATNAKAEFLVSSTDHLIGRYIEIVQDGVTYYRRVIKQGIADEAKYLYIYPDLPADITAADTYTIVGHHMVTPYEWFSAAAWAMTFRYRFGLGYPRGNNDWGKDIGDSRAIEYEGLVDPVRPGPATHEKSRCLTGSGPLTWSLNGQENGIWDLNGNVWEWEHRQVVTDGTGMVIAPGYPGAGTSVLPTGTSGQKILTLYAPDAPVGGLSMAPEIAMAATLSAGGSGEFGYDYTGWNIAANTYAALRGGSWNYGADCGLFCLGVTDAPSNARNFIGFRGAF